MLFTNTKKRNSHANAALTGIILVTEMTDNSRLLLPVLAACFSAMAVATMLRSRRAGKKMASLNFSNGWEGRHSLKAA